MERAIIKSENKNEYTFYDDPEWDVDYKKDEVEGVLNVEEKIGSHECEKSGLYENLKNYIDKVQNENNLPNKKYIVTYFKLCDDASGLEQLVDYNITKDQIIKNVNAQKYVEGADYFLMEQLKTAF